MKLRQKLAVVLASAMVVTAVPVVTMAASTNSLTKETLKVKKEVGFYEASTANALRVKFTDHISGDEVFYLDLDNAKWDEDVLEAAAKNEGFTVTTAGYEFTSNGATVKYERQNDTTMKVTVSGLATTGDPIVQLPLLAKTKDGDAKVSVVSKGGSTTVSQGSFVFATTAEKKISVTAANDKAFYTSGKLSEITIEEAYKGALAEGATFTIELADSDFKFDSASFTLEGKYGFSGYGSQTVTGEIATKDNGKLTITLPEMKNRDSVGTFVIKDLQVKSTVKNPEEGDFLVDVKGDDLVAEKTDLKVAKIAKYGTYISMKDDKAVDIIAGRIEDVEFTIGETVEDSIVGGREFEITLDNGHFDYKTLLNKYGSDKLELDKDGKEDEDHYVSTQLNVEKLMSADLIKDATFELNDVDTDLITKIYFDEDEDGEIIPETLIVELEKNAQINKEEDKMTFNFPVCVAIGNKDKESVTVKASGRALENEVSVKAVTIINPFNVTSEQAVLKVGLQGQVSGVITLTETDKEMFSKGDIKFSIKDKDEEVGIYLTDCTVETSGGIKGTKSEVNEGKKGNVVVSLNRTSKEAASITLKDMKFTTDRTVPEGTYDLEIKGTGIDADGHKLTIKEFIKISTSNTQDITASGLAKGVASFVIGESKYTLNDKEVTMDAPSYIQDPGYTMVPVRYVAQAFGVAESDILFGKGTVTIFAGERTISLTTGSSTAVVNGNNVAMTTKVVNKDGRTFVPAGQIASLLGIKSTWDSATKTATFENK